MHQFSFPISHKRIKCIFGTTLLSRILDEMLFSQGNFAAKRPKLLDSFGKRGELEGVSWCLHKTYFASSC